MSCWRPATQVGFDLRRREQQGAMFGRQCLCRLGKLLVGEKDVMNLPGSATVKEPVLAARYYNRKGKPTIAAHDLRRTAAAPALKGGVDLRQIQQMLGHASITSTERYLEPMRSLQVTAGDFIQIELALVVGR